VLHLSRETEAPDANLNFNIGSGINSGTIAGSSVTIAPSSITNTSAGDSFQTYEIVYGTPVGPLTSGTTYYLNLECEGSNGRPIYAEYAGSSTYANGTFYKDGNDDGKDMWFEIYGSANSDIATVTINVTPVNDAPVANNDSYTTLEAVSLTIPAAGGVLTNDTDVEGNALTALLVSSVTKGTLNLNANGGFTYTPNTNFNGSDSFTYRANDGTTNGNLATVTINITPVYDRPIAVNDSTNVLEDTSVTIKVLANDYNPDGTPLTITNTFTTNGTAVISGTNVIFRASTNFNGTAVFSYTIYDGSNSATASVTVTVTPVNDAPVAYGDTYTTLEDTKLTIPAGGILTNDTDVEGDALTALLVSNVTKGTLNLNANGGFTYTPNTNYNGSDSFTYRARDGVANGNIATVTINITPVYDRPIAVNDSTNVLEDTSVTVKVLANDYNPDGTPLTITDAFTTNGTAVISGTNVIFRASTNFNGTAVFSYTISDGTNSNSADVTVTVSPVNDPPVANNDTYTTLEDVPLIVPAAGILSNDTDVETNELTAWLVSDVTNGTLNLNTNGSFTYTPNTNYNGTDSFTYRARDGVYPILEENTSGGSGIDVQLGQRGAQSFRHGTAGDPGYTISKIVLYLSREATAPNANLDFTIGTGINSGAIAGSSGAIDPLSITNTSSGVSFQRYEIVYATPVGPLAAGTTYYLNLECEASNGKNMYTEYAGSSTYANGTYYHAGSNTGRDMKFAICDRTTSETATVTINVTAVNDTPFAVNDSTNVLEDASVTIKVLANDWDVEGTPLTITGTSTTNGTAVISGTDIVFTPSTNFNGTVVFGYTISDGTNSASASVTVTVTPVNDAPVANNDSYTTMANTLLTVPSVGPLTIDTSVGILANDTDANGDVLTALLVSDVAHGLLKLAPDGSFTYSPNSNYFGSDAFTYRASDGSLTSAVATVSLTILDNTPLSFSSAGMTAAGFELQLSGPTGSTYVILASTNMLDWTPIFTNSALTGSVVFTDTDAINNPVRFYRAVAR
jgi:VCBS repeat-containing protein